MKFKLNFPILIVVTLIEVQNTFAIRRTTIPANLTIPGYEAATYEAFDIAGSKYQYFIGWFAVDWFSAARLCHKNFWEFASIQDENQNDELIDVINKLSDTYDYWLSGTDLGNPGEFWWTSLGKPVEYFHWDRDEPKVNSAVDNCIKLFNRKHGRGIRWNVDDCGVRKTFICMQLKSYL